jgi:hypothetical protein
MHTAFEVHMLNPAGVEKAKKIAEAFDRFLSYMDKNFYTDNGVTTPTVQNPTGGPMVTTSRERSIMVTKLEEAAFFAKKALAIRKENQAV